MVRDGGGALVRMVLEGWCGSKRRDTSKGIVEGTSEWVVKGSRDKVVGGTSEVSGGGGYW